MISSSFCLTDIVPSPKSCLNISCNNSVVVLYVADIGPFEMGGMRCDVPDCGT